MYQMTKNKKIGIASAVIILVLIGIGIAAYQNKQTQVMIDDLTNQLINSTQNKPTITPETTSQITQPAANIAKDPQNATYIIEGRDVTLIDGTSQDGNTTIFDTPAVGDLNGDGVKDAGVILIVSGSGSGTFYYAATALNNTTDYIYEGTNALLLGDRIAPQTKSINNEVYTVNYADRAEGEPMSTQPSVGVSKYFKVNGSTLIETNN